MANGVRYERTTDAMQNKDDEHDPRGSNPTLWREQNQCGNCRDDCDPDKIKEHIRDHEGPAAHAVGILEGACLAVLFDGRVDDEKSRIYGMEKC